jgi:hypothetical protein
MTANFNHPIMLFTLITLPDGAERILILVRTNIHASPWLQVEVSQGFVPTWSARAPSPSTGRRFYSGTLP